MGLLGLESFLKSEHKKYRNYPLGVVCNQASTNKDYQHISSLLMQKELKLKVVRFFGPQHGIRGEKQDNMVESDDSIDPVTNLPVVSLYGKYREPQAKDVEGLGAFLIDLQDIGTRIYTFMYTMANCMRVAKKFGIKVIVLDRPNPINGVTTEGNVLEPAFASFVGQFPICVRHGMTMGELAMLFNEEFGIGCDLSVVRTTGWKRSLYWDEWRKDWICPSPNIPALQSAILFPGSVLFEGTNVSEGRGTTKPFEWIGAPFVKADPLAASLNKKKLGGVYFRPIFFQPTYQKGKDQVCGGVQIHVTSRKQFNSFKVGIHVLNEIATQFRSGFQWKTPPYEYEFERKPIDLIAGTSRLREAIDAGKSLKDFEEASQAELEQFRKIRKEYLIYK